MVGSDAEFRAHQRFQERCGRNRIGRSGFALFVVVCLIIWKSHGVVNVVCWCVAIAMFIGGIAYGRKRNKTERLSTVLWIRRFHRLKRTRREQVFLEQIVSPWGRLISIGDPDVSSSADVRYGTTLIGLLFAGTVVGYLIAKLLHLTLSEQVLSGMVGATSAFSRRAKHGAITLRQDGWQVKLAGALGSRSMYRGAGVILNCPRNTNLWREVVSSIVTEVHAAVVSIPEWSDAVEWELLTLRAVIGAEKIVVFGPHAPEIEAVIGGARFLTSPEMKVSWWLPTYVTHRADWKKATLLIGSAIEG